MLSKANRLGFIGVFVFAVLLGPVVEATPTQVDLPPPLMVAWFNPLAPLQTNRIHQQILNGLLPGNVSGHVLDDIHLRVRAIPMPLRQQFERFLFTAQNRQLPFYLDEINVGFLAASRAYFQLDFSQCLHHLKKTQPKKGFAKPNYFWGPVFFQAAVLQGVCHLALNQESPARLSFQQALRLRPEESLNLKHFSPAVIEIYEAEKKQFQKRLKIQPTVSVSLTSDPAFADLYLNGEYRGQSPLTISNLPPGRHYVQWIKSAWAPAYQVLDLPAATVEVSNKIVSLRETLLPEKTLNAPVLSAGPFDQPLAAVVWDDNQEDSKELLALMVDLLEVEELVLVGLKEVGWDYEIRLQGVNLRSGDSVEPISQVLIDLEDGYEVALTGLKQKLARQLGLYESTGFSDASTPGGSGRLGAHQSAHEPHSELLEPLVLAAMPAKNQPNPSRREPFYKTWWFWSAVGVMVAGAAIGTTVALMDNGSPVIGLSGPAAGVNSGSSQGVFVGQRSPP